MRRSYAQIIARTTFENATRAKFRERLLDMIEELIDDGVDVTVPFSRADQEDAMNALRGLFFNAEYRGAERDDVVKRFSRAMVSVLSPTPTLQSDRRKKPRPGERRSSRPKRS